MKKTCLIILLAFAYFTSFAQTHNIKEFGAKGDGVADDTRALLEGVKASRTLIIPYGTYNIKGLLSFAGIHDKTIIVQDNAIIRNTDNTKGTIYLNLSENITINGGTWTYVTLPTGNRTGAEHYFAFATCKNITVTNIHLIGSSEMGISLVADIGCNISNNIIEQCFRDAIYSHYSSNMFYCCNYIHDIKDDAMSIHDYGIPAQRSALMSAGIPQSGNAIVFNNRTSNTYQGFASIGCTRLFIANNTFTNTVTGGIAISNNELLFKGTTAHASKITISNNTLSYIGGKPHIINNYFQNDNQMGTGRAAIFVGVTDENGTINNPKSRITGITVNNNRVTNSHEDGAFIGEVDHLNFFGNTFTGNNTNRSANTGATVEIRDCTAVSIDKNTVNDTRTGLLSNEMAYKVDHTNGVAGQWNLTGKSPHHVDNSAIQAATESSKDILLSLDSFTLKPSEYTVIRKPFSPGMLTDYINLIPPTSVAHKLVYNACIDPDNQSLIIIVSNTTRQTLTVNTADWTVRAFFHN